MTSWHRNPHCITGPEIFDVQSWRWCDVTIVCSLDDSRSYPPFWRLLSDQRKRISADVKWPSWHLELLLNQVFVWHLTQTDKKNQKSVLLSLCEGNPKVTGGFPTQRDSNADNAFIWWRHNEIMAWWQTGDKPLPEPMMVKFTKAYLHHQTPMCYQECKAIKMTH